MHASTGYTPFYVIVLTHSRILLTLPRGGLEIGGGEVADWLADVRPKCVKKQVSEQLSTRVNVLQHVSDAMADRQDLRKEQADAIGRGCVESYVVKDPSASIFYLHTNVVSGVFKTKLHPRFINPSRSCPRKT